MTQLNPINLSKHHCDLAVIKCIDFRFRQADQQFIEHQFGVTDFDLIGWPGAAKAVVHDEAMREKMTSTVKNVCSGLHAIKKLVILNHWDCGGYGGSQAFSSVDEEAATYESDLRQARDILQPELVGIEIIMAYSRAAEGGVTYIIVQ